jgi:hypothetical protein
VKAKVDGRSADGSWNTMPQYLTVLGYNHRSAA